MCSSSVLEGSKLHNYIIIILIHKYSYTPLISILLSFHSKSYFLDFLTGEHDALAILATLFYVEGEYYDLLLTYV